MIKKRILSGLFAVALGALVLNPVVSMPASAKDLLTVDLINEPSTLDPHLSGIRTAIMFIAIFSIIC